MFLPLLPPPPLLSTRGSAVFTSCLRSSLDLCKVAPPEEPSPRAIDVGTTKFVGRLLPELAVPCSCATTPCSLSQLRAPLVHAATGRKVLAYHTDRPCQKRASALSRAFTCALLGLSIIAWQHPPADLPTPLCTKQKKPRTDLGVRHSSSTPCPHSWEPPSRIGGHGTARFAPQQRACSREASRPWGRAPGWAPGRARQSRNRQSEDSCLLRHGNACCIADTWQLLWCCC